jgi:TMEM175 potassium channel family protein
MTDQSTDGPSEGAGRAAEVELIAAERVIFFSDAVVAIAITLLALGLPLPKGSNNSDVWHSLGAGRDAYIAFLISFVVIGAHWRTHNRLYRAVARLDATAISLNMVWLLMIIVTPYATRILSGNGGFGVRFSLYAAIQVVTLVMLWLMSRHIRNGGLLPPGTPAQVSAADDVFVLVLAATFAISIPIAFITAVSERVYLIWVAAVIVLRWVRRAQRWKGREPSG